MKCVGNVPLICNVMVHLASYLCFPELIASMSPGHPRWLCLLLFRMSCSQNQATVMPSFQMTVPSQLALFMAVCLCLCTYYIHRPPIYQRRFYGTIMPQCQPTHTCDLFHPNNTTQPSSYCLPDIICVSFIAVFSTCFLTRPANDDLRRVVSLCSSPL